ncbi:hypothetical protein ACSLPA_34150, partial [Escherichia coli]
AMTVRPFTPRQQCGQPLWLRRYTASGWQKFSTRRRSSSVRELGGMTRNQHLLGKINSGQVDPLAAHYISPVDEDSYTLLH